MKSKLFSFIFFLVFIIELFAVYTQNINIRYFSKPAICIVLLIWLYTSTHLKGRYLKRIFVGLIFGLGGDIFLMLSGKEFFMYGLLSFLLCHLFYISAFTLDHKSNPTAINPYFKWAVGIFAMFCSGLFFYLQPKLGGMRLPVLIYAMVISFMAIMAVNRFNKVNFFSFKVVLFGALFFLLSDSILAINKFATPIAESGILIMSTYMMAQYLIVYGSIERKLLVTKTEI
jgi:uncharacterized membrane protein YhhN